MTKMAYDKKAMNRIRAVLEEKQVPFDEKKMFMGVCIMVDNKMLCGTHIDKKTGENILLARLSDDDYTRALENPDCEPMVMSGKASRNFVFIYENAWRDHKSLSAWIQQCLDFNPFAKASSGK